MTAGLSVELSVDITHMLCYQYLIWELS